MIFSYLDIYNSQGTIQKLANYPFDDVSLSYHIFKLVKVIDTHLGEIIQFINELQKNVNDLNENEEDKKSFYEESLKNFLEKKIDIEEANFQLSLSDLVGMKICAVDFNFIERFLINERN